jgi:hypothetical protein
LRIFHRGGGVALCREPDFQGVSMARKKKPKAVPLPETDELRIPIGLALAFLDDDVCCACLADLHRTFICGNCGLDLVPILNASEPHG